MTPSLGFRVQIASWLFAALLFAILPHKRSRWLLVPLTLLWANVHASAVLAPIVIGICAFGRALDDHEEAAPLALLTLLTAAATVATPLGLALPAYAFSTLTSPAGPLTNEWQRPPTTFLALAMAFIVAIAFAPRGRIGSGERLVTLALFLMMEGASRHVSLFFLGAAPYAAAAFPLRSYALAPRSSLATALGVLVSGAAFVTVLFTSHVFGRSLQPLPISAARYITGLPQARVFCDDFAWCGLLLGHRGVQVFLDGRADPFPRRVWSEFRVVRFEKTWNDALTRNGLDTVLVSKEDLLARRISRSGGWVRSYADRDYEVYRRLPRPRCTTTR
jgi:hypothetical protein